MTNIPPDEDNEQHTCESPEDASHDDELTPEVLSAAKEIIEDNPVDIEISSLRIFSMDKILDHIINTLSAATAEISSVSLRKNLIHEITDIPIDIRHIQSFDLYDNKIRRIQRLDNFGPSLKVLDLSYNQIKKIEGLDALCNLEQLYLVENRIQVIQGLSSLQRLRLLELGGNRIRHIDENSFEGLGELRELYLGKNKIECLQHLTSLMNLERISLQANRLTQCETGFETNHALKEVYLSENGINHIGQAIKHLSYLELLDFSFNPIASLSGLDDLACTKQLKEFWLTDGKIEDWSEVVRLQKFQSLHTVYLERNPIERDKRYRCKVYQELPWIHQIDSWPIVNRKNPETDRARDPRFASSE